MRSLGCIVAVALLEAAAWGAEIRSSFDAGAEGWGIFNDAMALDNVVLVPAPGAAALVAGAVLLRRRRTN